MKNKITGNRRTLLIGFGILIVGILIGWLMFGGPGSREKTVDEAKKDTIWTCSMHPQIRQNEPGQCPICGMDLIPLNSVGSSDDNPMAIMMSPTAMQLANIQTAIVKKEKPVKTIRMNGKVKADERYISTQVVHFPGRIERLLVNFTGEYVRKGQVLAYMYSPDLITAQEELLQANKIKDQQPSLFVAAKNKLRNLKVTESQIEKILSTGTAITEFPVHADVSGIVLNKRVNLGDYLMKGQSLFEIADLSRVWVLFDVYERDLPWIHKGDKVNFTVQSLPGENFEAKISFIDPVINSKTRVASARVEITNKDNKLRPEMFVTGVVKSPVQNKEEAIIVPKSAVMWTGERSIVYVKLAEDNGVSFVMREIELGEAIGDSYIVYDGLKVGEEIAVNGTFSIDAAAQLEGKPSMMNPEGGAAMTGHDHGVTPGSGSSSSQHIKKMVISKKAKDELKPLLEAYLKIKDALVSDDFESGKKALREFKTSLSKVNMGVFTGEAHNEWMKYSSSFEKIINEALKKTDLEGIRKSFRPLSDQMIRMMKQFGANDELLYIEYCPMADDNKGAEWLSREKLIKNPYFGSDMLQCGEVLEVIEK